MAGKLKTRANRRQEPLHEATIRDFGGGWNVIDTDLNLDTRFSTLMDNVVRAPDGSITVRQGTRLFKESTYLRNIINKYYYNERIVAVDDLGIISTIAADGSEQLVFNPAIAAMLPGAPAGWGPTDFVSFSIFKGKLTIHNGVNKPLLMDDSYAVSYLQDIATSTNVNTPIGKYCVTHSRYTVIAGNPSAPDRLYISSRDTSGTYVGDAPPNDAVNVDLGSRVPIGSSDIKGLLSYRDSLIIFFEQCVIIGKLGIYDSSSGTPVHTPEFEDAITEVGAGSHRSAFSIGDDVFFVDNVGVPSLKRVLFTGGVRPERASDLIAPEIQAQTGRLQELTIENNVFSIFDTLRSQYMAFIPDEDNAQGRTETPGYIYTYIPTLQIKAWSRIRGWNWQCAAKSAFGRVFFARQNCIYILGDEKNDPINMDYVGDQEMFDDDTVWDDGYGNSPTSDENSGVPIEFDWQLPWADFKKRMRKKKSRYIHIESLGTSKFTLDMFVDNILKNLDGDYDPALSMNFVAGSTGGFGHDNFGTDFGGGRNTREERLFAWTADFKIAKLRVWGAATGPLKIVSLTLAYQDGSIRR